jgi:hypothetical protein
MNQLYMLKALVLFQKQIEDHNYHTIQNLHSVPNKLALYLDRSHCYSKKDHTCIVLLFLFALRRSNSPCSDQKFQKLWESQLRVGRFF